MCESKDPDSLDYQEQALSLGRIIRNWPMRLGSNVEARSQDLNLGRSSSSLRGSNRSSAPLAQYHPGPPLPAFQSVPWAREAGCDQTRPDRMEIGQEEVEGTEVLLWYGGGGRE